MDDNVPAAERKDLAAFCELSSEEPEGEAWNVPDVEWEQYRDVEKTICDRGFRGDLSVIAPLVDVGDSDEGGSDAPGLSVDLQAIFFRDIMPPDRQGLADIGFKPPCPGFGEFPGHFRIHSYTGRAEE